MPNFAWTKDPFVDARRRLRFARLEKRYMLSGDFGELFETDDDDFDFDDDIREIFSDSDDSEVEELFEIEDSDDGTDFVARASNVQDSASLSASQSTTDDEGEPESDQLLDDRDNDLESVEDDELESSESEPTNQINTLTTQSNLSELESASVNPSQVGNFANASPSFDSVNDVTSDFDLVNELVFSAADSLGWISEPTLAESINLIDQDQPAEATPLAPAEADAALDATNNEQIIDEIVSDVDVGASEHPIQEVAAGIMPWIGSIADDLAAFDDAFHEFMNGAQSLTEESFASFTRPSTGQAAFLTIAGIAVAREVAKRHQRKIERDLKDEIHAGRFDVRLYPELFG